MQIQIPFLINVPLNLLWFVRDNYVSPYDEPLEGEYREIEPEPEPLPSLKKPCPVRDCSHSTEIPVQAAMCMWHWKQLPQALQKLIWDTYSSDLPWDSQSPEYRAAVESAIKWIDEREGRRPLNPDSDRAGYENGRKDGVISLVPVSSFHDAGRIAAQEKFLREYSENASVRAGCEAAGVKRSTVDDWLKKDPNFAARFTEAKEDYNDRLREAIVHRAVEGVPKRKVVVYKGEVTDEWWENEYSDGLLTLEAKARMPEYRNDRGGDENHVIPLAAVRDILDRLDEVEGQGIPAPNYAPIVPEPVGHQADIRDKVIDGEFEVVDLRTASEEVPDYKIKGDLDTPW